MKTKNFIITAILYYLLCVGNNLIHPITTPFLQQQLQIDEVYFGIYYAFMSLGLVVGALLCGKISKKIPSNILLFIGFCGYALFQLLFGFSGNNANLIIVWRFFSGLFIAFPNTLFLIIAVNHLKSEERVRGLMIMTALNILGVATGYEIGGLMHDYVFNSFNGSFALQACWCLICAVLCFCFIQNKSNSKVEEKTNKKVKIKYSVNQIIFFVILFLFSVSAVTVSKFFEPFFQNIGNQMFTSSDLAHYTLLTSGCGMIANIVLIPLLKRKKNLKSDILFAFLLFFSAVLVFISFLPSSEKLLIIFLFTCYLGYTIIRNIIPPLEQNIIVSSAENDETSSLLSTRQAVLSAGQVVGPLLFSGLFSINMRLPFFISAGLYLIAFILMTIYLMKKSKRE